MIQRQHGKFQRTIALGGHGYEVESLLRINDALYATVCRQRALKLHLGNPRLRLNHEPVGDHGIVPEQLAAISIEHGGTGEGSGALCLL